MAEISGCRYEQVRRVYDRALRLPEAQRAAYLEEACGEDPDVRGEVEALLGAAATGPDVVERSRRAIEAVADQVLDEALGGAVVGGYRIVRCVGRGGMGTVYEAVRDDPDAPARVAIKLLHRSLDGEAARERFRRERRILAGLEHPGIARFLDTGTHEGRSFVVMEFVEGAAIDGFCEHSAAPLRRRLELLADVCDAVQYAHAKLVVHRDIKPANVLVTADGHVKLLDFGIAKLLEEEPAQPALTVTGGAVMTPEYASPEQIRGESVATASDVYQLGALLYRVLTGSPPFEVPNRAPATLSRLLEQEPVRPSEAAARGGAGAILEAGRAAAGELDDIVMMALRKEPERRYASANLLAMDLRRFLDGQPILARPDSVGYRTRKFMGRHRAGVAAGASSALALTTGVIGILWQARRAEREAARARTERGKASRIASFLEETLSAGDPRHEGREARIADALDQAAVRIDTDLADQPDIAASLHGTLSRTYLELGLYAQAEAEARAALAMAEGGEASDRELARPRLDLGLALVRKGEYREAEPLMRAAIRGCHAAGSAGRLDLAEALNCFGILLEQTGRSHSAERAYKDALAIYAADLEGADDRPAGTLNNLAVVYGNRGKTRRAERLHRRALGIIREVHGEEHPDVAYTLYNLAGVLDIQGKFRESERAHREALAMRERVLGEDHPLTIQSRTSLASVLSLDGRHEEAVSAARAALDRATAALPPEHPFTAYAASVLGHALLESGQLAEAEEALREALRIRRGVFAPDHWLVANVESLLGETLRRRGGRREARPLLEAAYRKLLNDRGPRHEKTMEARRRLEALGPARARGRRARRRTKLGRGRPDAGRLYHGAP